jgi:hypothetical protein
VLENVPPSAFAWVFSGLGVIDPAIGWPHRSIDERDPMANALKVWPLFDPVSAHPRQPHLLRKMKLEP